MEFALRSVSRPFFTLLLVALGLAGIAGCSTGDATGFHLSIYADKASASDLCSKATTFRVAAFEQQDAYSAPLSSQIWFSYFDVKDVCGAGAEIVFDPSASRKTFVLAVEALRATESNVQVIARGIAENQKWNGDKETNVTIFLGKVTTYQTLRNSGTVSIPSPGKGMTATALMDHRVLIGGGMTDSSYSSKWYIFNPSTQSLTEVTGGGARAYHTATLMPDGNVLIVGGRNDSVTGNLDVVLFDSMGQRFITIGQFPATSGRFNHVAAITTTSDGLTRVVIAGGKYISTDATPVYQDDIWIYQMENGQFFQSTTRMSMGRSNFAAVKLSDKRILLHGGARAGSLTTALVELFDVNTQSIIKATDYNEDATGVSRAEHQLMHLYQKNSEGVMVERVAMVGGYYSTQANPGRNWQTEVRFLTTEGLVVQGSLAMGSVNPERGDFSVTKYIYNNTPVFLVTGGSTNTAIRNNGIILAFDPNGGANGPFTAWAKTQTYDNYNTDAAPQSIPMATATGRSGAAVVNVGNGTILVIGGVTITGSGTTTNSYVGPIEVYMTAIANDAQVFKAYEQETAL